MISILCFAHCTEGTGYPGYFADRTGPLRVNFITVSHNLTITRPVWFDERGTAGDWRGDYCSR